MSEKLCLKWNDFQANVNTAFGNLREDTEFNDVTLACEDGQQIWAHKVILAVSSPFFQNLFQRNQHPHPLIYMRGVKSEDLLAIVDFLYRGEANVLHESLESFLAIAEDLGLKGLSSQKKDLKEEIMKQLDGNQTTDRPFHSEAKSVNQDFDFEMPERLPSPELSKGKPVTVPTFKQTVVSGDFHELDEKVKSMMERAKTPKGKRKGKG